VIIIRADVVIGGGRTPHKVAKSQNSAAESAKLHLLVSHMSQLTSDKPDSVNFVRVDFAALTGFALTIDT
jgi:hypothetical protein